MRVADHYNTLRRNNQELIFLCHHEARGQHNSIYLNTFQEYSTCTRYAYNFSTCTNHCAFSCDVDQPDVNTTVCDYGYVYDDDVYGETTVTQVTLAVNAVITL